MSTKAIIFDLDDTLLWDERSVQETFASACAIAEARSKVDPQKLEEAVRQEARALYETYETYGFTKNVGINPFEALWANFHDDDHDPMFLKLRELAPLYRKEAWTRGLKSLGVDDAQLGAELAEHFHQDRRKRPIVYEETFEVLDALRQNYRLFLLTNGSPDLQNEKLTGVPELSPYFERIFISGAFGQGKPARALYDHVLQTIGLRAAECVMVGDKLTTDIQGANTAGMPSVWINRHGKPLEGPAVPTHQISNLRELQPLLERTDSK